MASAMAAVGGSFIGFEPRSRTMSTAENHHNMHPIELVLDRLRAAGKRVRQSRPDQWEAQCPAHDDGSPSLGINESPIGKVLLHCHAGCQVPEICRALDLRMVDLFPDSPLGSGKGLQERARYLYTDEHGEVLFTVVRYVDLATGKKTFRANGNGRQDMKGVRRVPYNLPQLGRARTESKRAWITEGEKDAENLQWHVDGAVTTNPFGAGKWDPAYNEHFRGLDVTIVADDDTVGRGHADEVAIHLAGIAASVTVLLPAEGCKDVTDHLNAGHTLAELRPLEGAAEVAEDDDQDEWEPRSLREIAESMLAGTHELVKPTVLSVRDDVPLFYPGRINSLFGESGGGKTWVALMAHVEEAKAGRLSALIDYEDTAEGIAERLLALGLTPAEIELVHYYNPMTGIGGGIEALMARAHDYSLVSIDSTGEAMAAGGVNGNDDAEAAVWFAAVKRLRKLPQKPAINVLDHVPKATDAPSLYSIGSQRKRAAITGASYRVDTLAEFARGQSGQLKLTVAKDRHGNRKQNATILVDIEAGEGGAVEITIRQPPPETQAGATAERVRPVGLMERISELIESAPGIGATALKTNLGKRMETVLVARDLLVREGYIRTELKGQTLLHFSVRIYRKMLDPLNGPVDKYESSSPVPPFPPVPTRSGNEARVPVPPFPTPLGGTGSGTGTGTGSLDEPIPVDNFFPTGETA